MTASSLNKHVRKCGCGSAKCSRNFERAIVIRQLVSLLCAQGWIVCSQSAPRTNLGSRSTAIATAASSMRLSEASPTAPPTHAPSSLKALPRFLLLLQQRPRGAAAACNRELVMLALYLRAQARFPLYCS